MKKRDVLKMISKYPLTVVSITCATHWKVRVRRRDGTERNVTFPNTESDNRALKNKAAQLRNIAYGAE